MTVSTHRGRWRHMVLYMYILVNIVSGNALSPGVSFTNMV